MNELLSSTLQYGTVPDWVSAVATLAAFTIAVSAYASWKHQHRAKAQENLAHAILKTVYRLQDMLEDAKSPGFDRAEYDGWYNQYREQSSELRSLVHESAIYWGDMLDAVALDFWKARVEVTQALQHHMHDLDNNSKDNLFKQKDHEVLWGEAHDKKIRGIVREFEGRLSNKHIQ